jgi:Zn-dependent protease with chaperone function
MVSPGAWRFHVIDSDAVNAFVLPGGYVFVHKGLAELLLGDGDNTNDARGMDALAVVLSHELAHLVCRHAAERLSVQRFPSLLKWAYAALALFGVVTPDGVVVLLQHLKGIDLATTVLVGLPYSRLHEGEADARGLGLMAAACVPPNAAPGVWAKLAERERARAARPGGSVLGRRVEEEASRRLGSVLSTHPSSADRAAALTALVPANMQAFRDHGCEGPDRKKLMMWDLFSPQGTNSQRKPEN